MRRNANALTCSFLLISLRNPESRVECRAVFTPHSISVITATTVLQQWCHWQIISETLSYLSHISKRRRHYLFATQETMRRFIFLFLCRAHWPKGVFSLALAHCVFAFVSPEVMTSANIRTCWDSLCDVEQVNTQTCVPVVRYKYRSC